MEVGGAVPTTSFNLFLGRRKYATATVHASVTLSGTGLSTVTAGLTCDTYGLFDLVPKATRVRDFRGQHQRDGVGTLQSRVHAARPASSGVQKLGRL